MQVLDYQVWTEGDLLSRVLQVIDQVMLALFDMTRGAAPPSATFVPPQVPR